MLETPGCWAWDEMGALLAGVFCGVLKFSGAGSVVFFFPFADKQALGTEKILTEQPGSRASYS